eukprot:189887-Chlamydomonas_euryale.AAC.1
MVAQTLMFSVWPSEQAKGPQAGDLAAGAQIQFLHLGEIVLRCKVSDAGASTDVQLLLRSEHAQGRYLGDGMVIHDQAGNFPPVLHHPPKLCMVELRLAPCAGHFNRPRGP